MPISWHRIFGSPGNKMPAPQIGTALGVVRVTQAQYDSLTVKDPNIMYVITPA